MEHKNSIPLSRQGSGAVNQGDDPATALFGRLDALNREVNGLLNDPNVRRMALEVGIALLAKKYPALSVLLRAFGDTGAKQATAGRAAVRKAAPVKKRRGIK